MSFSQTRPQLSLDTYKSHDNLVDPNVTAFTPNDQHKSYFLDTSVSLFFPIHDRFSGSNFPQKERKGDFFDEDDGDLTARTAYPPTPQLPPPDSRKWWQKVCVSLHSFMLQNPFFVFFSFIPDLTRFNCMPSLCYHSTSGDNHRLGHRGRSSTTIP
jgi:hypothetical protein